MRSRRLAAALTLVALAAVGCGEEGETAGTTVRTDLEAFDYYFEPTSLVFDEGTRATVSFTNNGSATHSFSSPDLDLDVEAGPGDTADVSFDVPPQPGSVEYYCKFHPDEMKGTISIGGAGEPVEEPAESPEDDDEDVDVDVEGDNY